ncbi:hypothetical protein NDI85_14740 [Halomicroarcula sp. S1AR25-4]|uniref:prenyltransferase/squalene oxidase repeat-containing protein n=1 Tax=Haloarcula sp. S1AR25-4 TaxID=2950538 RepID=UPI002876B484|nr:prenyltransferase/squalene oxidase repeat-containing protein [Halomicroarcula sp. S1AR25-4]MDS0279055.1 hypothetical protein [Halomicroarcula sp. S1AR25-4]
MSEIPSDTSAAAVEDAVTAARTALFEASSYRSDHWEADCSLGPDGIGDVRFTIHYALTLTRLRVDAAARDRAVEYALSRRADDGGWGDAAANFGGRLLLHVLPGDYGDERAAVEAEIEREGMRLVPEDPDDLTFPLFRMQRFYALMSDEYAVETLFPNDEHLQIGRILWQTPGIDDGGVDYERHTVHPHAIDALLVTAVLGGAIESQRPDGEDVDTDLPVEVLLDRRLRSGNWKTSPDNVFAVLALSEAGYDPDGPELRPALDWLREQRLTDEGCIVQYRLSVWDTAWALQALFEAGADPETPEVADALDWLEDATSTDEAVLDRDPAQFREHFGSGWGFRPAMYADWDDTAAALTALARGDRPVDDAAVQFLVEAQRSDGAWSGFLTDFDPLPDAIAKVLRQQAGEETYELLFASPACPDVTGHALEALGEYGYTAADAVVADALDYLERSVTDADMWMGVWGDGYTYGTSRVLVGLDAVGETDRDVVADAVDALLAAQNDDGGWGERSNYSLTADVDALDYRVAPSTAEQTAWAVQGLLAAGVDADHSAVRAGVEWLLSAQGEDGRWEPTRVMYNKGAPRYLAPAVTQTAALQALAAYDRAR